MKLYAILASLRFIGYNGKFRSMLLLTVMPIEMLSSETIHACLKNTCRNICPKELAGEWGHLKSKTKKSPLKIVHKLTRRGGGVGGFFQSLGLSHPPTLPSLERKGKKSVKYGSLPVSNIWFLAPTGALIVIV